MNIIFDSLELRNFQSYGNNLTKINLNTNTATYISGKNFDSAVDGQVDSNGAGKTTIFNALLEILTNTNSFNIPKNKLVNHTHGKNMEIALNLRCDGKYYRFEKFRNHKAKGGTGAFILCKDSDDISWDYSAKKDGGHDITNDSTLEVQESIQKIIKYAPSILNRVILMSVGKNNKPFLEMNADEQRSFIEELMGFSELSEKSENLKIKIKNNNKELEILQKLDEQIKLEIERYNKQLQSVKTNLDEWDNTNKSDLTKLKNEIANHNHIYEGIDYDYQEKLINNLSKLGIDNNALQNSLKDLNLKLNEINSQLLNINNWRISNDFKISQIKKEIQVHDITYANIDFDEEERHINLLQENKALLVNKTQEFDKLNNAIDNNNVIVNNIKNWELNKFNRIKALESLIDDTTFLTTQEDIDTVKSELTKFESNNSDILNELKRKNILLNNINNNLNEKNIRKNELDKNILHLSDSKCPFCSQTYLEAKTKLTKEEEKLVLINSDIIKLTDELSNIKSEISKINYNLDCNNNDKSNFIIEIFGNAEVDINSEVVKGKTYISNKLKLDNELSTKNPYISESISIESLNKNNSELFINKNIISNDINNIKNIISNLETDLFFKNIKDITTVKLNINASKSKLESLQNEKNPYLLDTTENVLELTKNDISNKIFNVNKEINDIELKISDINQNKYFDNIKDITTTKLSIKTLNDKLNSLSELINPYKKSYDELLSLPLSELKTKEIQELYTTIEHQDFLLKLLTKKDSFVRKALINRYIPFLNGRIKYYLSKIGLPYNVELQQDMTIKITKFKQEIEYNGLSTGQRARINVALPFAFRDVLQIRYGVISLCMMDEVLDHGLSDVGVQLSVKMIKEIAKENNLSLFIISHKDISSMFDHTLNIELRNGFSKIVDYE